jgi:hypothetical protein
MHVTGVSASIRVVAALVMVLLWLMGGADLDTGRSLAGRHSAADRRITAFEPLISVTLHDQAYEQNLDASENSGPVTSGPEEA